MQLTLQLYADHRWRDVMRLEFEQPEKGQNSPCSFGYDQHYLVENLQALGSTTAQSVSAMIPLTWDLHRTPGFPPFLRDILPAGAARRFLLARLAIPEGENTSADLTLLQRCTPAPVGHLRIKESVDALGAGRSIGFGRSEVITRDSRFLEFAYEQGAVVGGATGAGGEAPKLLLAEDAGGLLHPDATLADDLVRQHWLVKFSRNKGNETDRTILRSEFCYYQALQRIGVNTVSCDGMTLEEAAKPSLWMQRFDRTVSEDGVQRLALSPIYDLAPMVMDEEGITRTTKWPDPVERAGEVDWMAACRSLAVWGDSDQWFDGLRNDARRFVALPDLLSEAGLPDMAFKHPRIALSPLDAKLKAWGLL